MLIYIIFLTIFILVTSVTYYKACIKPAEEFTYLTSIKTLGKATLTGFAYGGFFLGLNTLYEVAIPIHKSHGIEFNAEREQLGLPKIGVDWKSIKYQSDQFTTNWSKMEPTNGHFKKVIEYGIFTATSETDYYKKDTIEGTLVFSKYDFGTNTSEYFIEKPNYKSVSVTESEKSKDEKPTIIQKIRKSEFERFVEH